MALLLEKPTVYGVNATYWRVIFVQIDFGTNRLFVSLAGYSSADARANGSAPLCQEQIAFEAEAFIPDATRDAVYAAVKAGGGWESSQDA